MKLCQLNCQFYRRIRRKRAIAAWNAWLEEKSTVGPHLMESQRQFVAASDETLQYAPDSQGAAVTTSHGLNQTNNDSAGRSARVQYARDAADQHPAQCLGAYSPKWQNGRVHPDLGSVAVK